PSTRTTGSARRARRVPSCGALGALLGFARGQQLAQLLAVVGGEGALEVEALAELLDRVVLLALEHLALDEQEHDPAPVHALAHAPALPNVAGERTELRQRVRAQ